MTQGLTTEDAARRFAAHGPNEIQREQATSPGVILARQFKSPVIWLLLGACALSGVLGEIVDALAIGSIVVVNSLVGFFQEFRAERAVLALRSMTASRARVLRDGRSSMIAAAEVVPGDVLMLEVGDIVAADARLIEANLLTTNEALLTGESAPVEKSLAAVAPEAPLAERHDCVFMGTTVANGTGKAEVLAWNGHRARQDCSAHPRRTAA
jgi:P-type Ca2+ transporter type 2C